MTISHSRPVFYVEPAGKGNIACNPPLLHDEVAGGSGGLEMTNDPRKAARRLHPGALRMMHWINAAAMIVMIGSGWKIYDNQPIFGDIAFPLALSLGGNPAVAFVKHGDPGFGGALLWHFAAMWVLTLNGLAYVGYGLATGPLPPHAAADPPARHPRDDPRDAAPAPRPRGPDDLQRRAEAPLHRRDHARRRADPRRPGDLEAGAILLAYRAVSAATTPHARCISSA